MNKRLTEISFIFYPFLWLLLSIYSYTQVDLNLTLSSNRIYQLFQSKLLYLGYYDRPHSALLFFTLVILLYLSYFLILKLVSNSPEKSGKYIILGICIISILALFSYPALSHDFFNYLFDARIVTKYHQNPYFFKALDFPGDLWTRFMHWTHRTYPYGPAWLLFTLPFSFFGFGKFVLTLLLFKLMFVTIYLLNIKTIDGIFRDFDKKNRIAAVAFFAFNPLIVVETLISPHNESLMLLFLLLSLRYLLNLKNKIIPVLCLLLSVAVKFVTVVLLPVYLFVKPEIKNNKLVLICLCFLSFPLLLEIYNREAYPWYFVPLIGMTSLSTLPKVKNFLTVLSFGALLRYLPYLSTGEYTVKGNTQMNYLLLIPLILYLFWQLFGVIPFYASFSRKRKK